MSQGALYEERREYGRQRRRSRLFEANQHDNILRQRLEQAAAADAARLSGPVPDVPWDDDASAQKSTGLGVPPTTSRSLPRFEDAISFASLRDVTQALLASGANRAGGRDRFRFRDFSDGELNSVVRNIHEAVIADDFEASRSRIETIQKASGGLRYLTLRSLPYRILARRMYNILSTFLEPIFLDTAYCWRPRRGPWHFILALEKKLIGQNAWFATHDDIHKFFDSVRLDTVLTDFQAVLAGADPRYLCVEEVLLRGHPRDWRWDRRPGIGFDQGGALSGLAATLHRHRHHDVLLQADQEQTSQLQFGDNLVAFASTPDAVLSVRRKSEELLCDQGLRLGTKPHVIDLRAGERLKVLGLEVFPSGDTVAYAIPAKAFERLDAGIRKAAARENPRHAVSDTVHGWLGAYGMAHTGDARPLITRLQSMAQQHDYDLTENSLWSSIQSAHAKWQNFRRLHLGVK